MIIFLDLPHIEVEGVLERELRAKGYKGSQKAIYHCLARLGLFVNAPVKHSSASSQPKPLLALSAPQATWLFFRKEEDLKAEERENLLQLRQASPDLETAYQLVKAFLRMVRELNGEQLEDWLGKVQTSHLQAFESFATGVQQDKNAILAGLTLPWSNGPVEGQVNRLKLIKRSMYGQADLGLLKRRVLHRSKRSQERKERQGQQLNRPTKPRVMEHRISSQPANMSINEVA